MLLEDAEAERHVKRSSTLKLVHRPLETQLASLAERVKPPAPEAQPSARPISPLVIEIKQKVEARIVAEIKEQIEALKGQIEILTLELHELEHARSD